MQSKIALVTDTDASLPPALAQEYGIQLVPITVQFNDEVLQSGIDIDDKGLFERIEREGTLPTTAAPSPGDFAQAYKAAIRGGAEQVICFCVSSKVSATYEAALAARQLTPSVEVEVVDTKSLSMGQGFMVLEAAQTLAAGGNKDAAIQKALDVGKRTHLFAALATLEYLAMSGRVGYLAAGMANILSIKPILSIQDGSLELLERVRTQKRAWQRILELVGETGGDRPIEKMAFIHVAAQEQLADFRSMLCQHLECPPDVLEAELTPGLSVHAGAGVVGVAFVAGETH